MNEGFNLVLLGNTSDCIFLLISESISSNVYNSFTLTSTTKLHSEGTILCALFCVLMEVTAMCTGPRMEDTFGNRKVLNQVMSFTALYTALTPSFRAACPAIPYEIQSSTNKPLAASAIFIRV